MKPLHGRPRHVSTPNAPLVITGIALGLLATGLLLRYTTKSRRRSDLAVVKKAPTSMPLEASVNINRSAEELYTFWRSFTSLPEIMPLLQRIDDLGTGVTRWVAKGSKGPTFVWESQVTEDIPNKQISWQSLEGSDVSTWGHVRFLEAPQQRGTDVVVQMSFKHGAKKASSVAKGLLDELEKGFLQQSLRNFKSYMETGEVPTNKTQRATGQETRRIA